MKIEYNISYLTSPKDVRLDNSIGQHFVLSYLNSEPNTSYGFRYRPFGIGDVMVNDTVKMAERPISKSSTKRYDDISLRVEHEQIGHVLDTVKFPKRTVKTVLAYEYFDADIKDISTIVYILIDGIKQIKKTQDHQLLFGDEYKTIHDGLMDRLQIPSKKRNDLLGIVKHSLTKISDEKWKIDDAIEIAGNVISMVIHRPESLLLGEALLSQMRFLRDAATESYDQFSTKKIQEIDILMMLFADHQEYYGREHIDSRTSERWDQYGLKQDEIYAIRWEQFGQKEDEIHGDRSDQFGLIRETIVTKRMPREESIVYSMSFGGRKEKVSVVDTALLTDKFINIEGVDINNTLLFVSIDSINGVIEQASIWTERYGKESMSFIVNKWLTWHGRDITSNEEMKYVTIDNVEGKKVTDITLASNEIGNPAAYELSQIYVDINSIKGFIDNTTIDIELNKKDGLIIERIVDASITKEVYISDIVLTDLVLPLGIIILDRIMVDYDLKDNPGPSTFEAFINQLDSRLVINTIRKGTVTKDNEWVSLDNIDGFITNETPFVEKWQTEAFEMKEIQKRSEKVARESMLFYLLLYTTHNNKTSMIVDNWAFLQSLSSDAYEIEGELRRYTEEQSRDSFLLNYVESGMNEKESLLQEYVSSGIIENHALVEYLILMDRAKIDTLLLTLIGADRQEYWNNLKIDDTLLGAYNEIIQDEGMELREAINLQTFSKDAWRQENRQKALIQALVNAHETSENRHEGYVKKDDYLLAGDGSDWEDIWKRYSRGVDILDPPDSDFDYAKLASSVYDKKTGVPFKPLSPTNVADVKVTTPLHHPLPEHFDLGVDDLKELVVDNFAYIDILLAIESLKNRNTLRYAGMSAEKTMRELFSKLFVWIRDATHTDETYDRMFRFCRWYAEAIVVKMSTHILHRTYEQWRSTFHEMKDMGIPYEATGWSYIQSALSIQTTTDNATLKFTKENYIDGQLIVRGYFDNPLNEGTMKIMVDDEVVYTSTKSGAFTATVDVPQGKHIYRCLFTGDSGRVSISTIEITGCQFVSAHTTSDDSDTNGLKATTLLVGNLLEYFDAHHGEGKTKGTMAVKQRRVWNTQT